MRRGAWGYSPRDLTPKRMSFADELDTLIRARYPILYLVTSEEVRLQSVILEVARRQEKRVFEWTATTGLLPAGTSIQSQKSRQSISRDPLAALDQVIDWVEPALFVFKDLHPFLDLLCLLGRDRVMDQRKVTDLPKYPAFSFVFKQETKADKPTKGSHLPLKFFAPQG